MTIKKYYILYFVLGIAFFYIGGWDLGSFSYTIKQDCILFKDLPFNMGIGQLILAIRAGDIYYGIFYFNRFFDSPIISIFMFGAFIVSFQQGIKDIANKE